MNPFGFIKDISDAWDAVKNNPALFIVFLILIPLGIYLIPPETIKALLDHRLALIYYYSLVILGMVAYMTYYAILSRLPLPKDRFVIRIANFRPVADDAINASKNFPHRLKREIEALGDKEIDVKLLHVDIKGQNEAELKPLAKKIGRRHRAHMVIFGDVCCTAGMGCSANGDYEFEPVIVLTEGAVIKESDQNAISGMDYIPQPYKDIIEIRDTVRFILGLKKYESEDYNSACDIFRSIPANNAEILFYLGNSEESTSNLEAAVSVYDEAIRLKSDMAEVHNNKGIALNKLGRYDEAMKSYDEAIRLKPDYAAAYNNKGNALGKLGRYVEAIECFEEAIRLKPDNFKVLNNKGIALSKLGRYEDAIKSYDAAIRLNPKLAEAHNNKGNVLGMLNRPEESILCFDKAISLKPDYADAHYNKGNALFILGRTKEAKTQYDRAREINPLRVQFPAS